jgi:hypothetical protein
MSNVIGFKPSPLSPFLGKWVLDPLSVSRDKVVKRTLGQDGLKKLWACGSMEERAQCLAAEPELAKRYESVVRFGRESHLVVTLQTIAWNYSQSGYLQAETTVCPVIKVTVEGRKAIVHTIDSRPERRGQPVGYVFRLNRQWLLVSEQYKGLRAQHFPRSPIFRYYASN